MLWLISTSLSSTQPDFFYSRVITLVFFCSFHEPLLSNIKVSIISVFCIGKKLLLMPCPAFHHVLSQVSFKITFSPLPSLHRGSPSCGKELSHCVTHCQVLFHIKLAHLISTLRSEETWRNKFLDLQVLLKQHPTIELTLFIDFSVDSPYFETDCQASTWLPNWACLTNICEHIRSILQFYISSVVVGMSKVLSPRQVKIITFPSLSNHTLTDLATSQSAETWKAEIICAF